MQPNSPRPSAEIPRDEYESIDDRCIVRPHYGLSMGRAVFCVTHKKEGMVHLLREAQMFEKEALKR